MKTNCFVASAFNESDVDLVYDRAIKPVLKKLRVEPLRVDRIEHNEDIDDKIFNLISRSQLGIADLTHARPSVYYEAGYIFGSGKPVVYIARKDHFHPRHDDPKGNFRIHFDLQMKNIISWTQPNRAFKERLRTRLIHILQPIYRQQRQNVTQSQNERRFALQSQHQQLSALLKTSQSLLRVRGFKSSRRSGSSGYDCVHLYKSTGKVHRRVHVVALPTINKSQLYGKYGYLIWPHTAFNWDDDAESRRIETTHVLIGLNKVKKTSLSSLFPAATPLAEYVFKGHERKSRGDKCSSSTVFVIMDDVKSLEDCKKRFRSALLDIVSGKYHK